MCCRHVCPYHASRDVLNEGAALVFVTYSQLLDPPVRSANGLDDLLQGAVLVFDEVLHHLFGPHSTEQSMPPCRLLSKGLRHGLLKAACQRACVAKWCSRALCCSLMRYCITSLGQQNTEHLKAEAIAGCIQTGALPCCAIPHWIGFQDDMADAFCRLLVLCPALTCCIQACLACTNIPGCNAMSGSRSMCALFSQSVLSCQQCIRN